MIEWLDMTVVKQELAVSGYLMPSNFPCLS